MIVKNRILKYTSGLIACYLLAVLLPFPLHWDGLSQLVSNFYGEQYELIELFGFSASLALLLWAYFESRLVRPSSWQARLPIWLTVFIGLFWLSILIETSTTSGDYPCYENAAAALQINKNPYRGCYFYPPLLAQGLAMLEKSIILIGWLLGITLRLNAVQPVVFYLFQSLQLLLIVLSFRFSLILATELKLKSMVSLALTTSLFLLNTPLLRTVILHQVNLWILAAILSTILLLRNKPFWAGIITAFSGHIKIYPLILALPFLARKKWRALLGLLIGLVFFALLPIALGYRWIIWQQFGEFFQRFPQYNAPRNNSLYSLSANLLLLAGVEVTSKQSLWYYAPRLVYYLLVILMVLWLAWRYYQWRRSLSGQQLTGSKFTLLFNYAFLMDMVAAQLLVSPSLWEHQWIIVIPFVLWAFSYQFHLSRQAKLQAAISATLLIYALPSFDIIPFGYLRLVGLLILMWITNPTVVQSIETPSAASPE